LRVPHIYFHENRAWWTSKRAFSRGHR
jgi:hypothetical protein